MILSDATPTATSLQISKMGCTNFVTVFYCKFAFSSKHSQMFWYPCMLPMISENRHVVSKFVVVLYTSSLQNRCDELGTADSLSSEKFWLTVRKCLNRVRT